jgi:hypothetical protein
LIAGDISIKFCLPELYAALGGIGESTAGMSMPEAAVDHNGEFPAGQNDVGSTGKVAPVKPKAQS